MNMINSKVGELTLINTYQVKCLSPKRVQMVRKFLDEMVKISSLWSGKTRVFVEDDPNKSESMETITVNPRELPFDLEIISVENLNPATFKDKKSIVYITMGHKHADISKYCRIANVPSVYISEFTLNTRQQMKTLSTQNPLLRLRRTLWEGKQERKQVKAIKIANGLHANGTPTYEEYRQINSNSILYFDNRVPQELLATDEDIELRTGYLCDNNQPIRLCFSGRLIKIKGADHLIEIAEKLREMQVPFQMSICGDGELKQEMQSQINLNGLQNQVKLLGNLNFHSQLIPLIKNNIDLFICCHRQGDPSCTYLETMSCGVPIIGYANEAFSGIVKCSQAGWLIDMDKPKLLANKIAELNLNRKTIREMSFKALKFACEHSFEQTYEKRVNHLYKTCWEYYNSHSTNNIHKSGIII